MLPRYARTLLLWALVLLFGITLAYIAYQTLAAPGESEYLTPQTATTTEPVDTQPEIVLEYPAASQAIESPLVIRGEAPGFWYFEASFPVVLTNWDGLIIAEGYVEAQDDWMTTEFVPFEGTLEFESPYAEGDPDFMKRGALILQRDNPSGLPKYDAAHEIVVFFAPQQ